MLIQAQPKIKSWFDLLSISYDKHVYPFTSNSKWSNCPHLTSPVFTDLQNLDDTLPPADDVSAKKSHKKSVAKMVDFETAEYIPQVYRGRFGRKHRFHRVRYF